MSRNNRFILRTLVVGSCFLACVAKADIVAVVSAKSTIGPLSKSQMEAIFLGKSSRLPDGRAALPLDLVEGAPERDRFYSALDGKSPAQLKAYWSKIIFTGRGQPPRAVANGIDMRKAIAENPLAIGYIDAALLDVSVRVLLQP